MWLARAFACQIMISAGGIDLLCFAGLFLLLFREQRIGNTGSSGGLGRLGRLGYLGRGMVHRACKGSWGISLSVLAVYGPSAVLASPTSRGDVGGSSSGALLGFGLGALLLLMMSGGDPVKNSSPVNDSSSGANADSDGSEDPGWVYDEGELTKVVPGTKEYSLTMNDFHRTLWILVQHGWDEYFNDCKRKKCPTIARPPDSSTVTWGWLADFVINAFKSNGDSEDTYAGSGCREWDQLFMKYGFPPGYQYDISKRQWDEFVSMHFHLARCLHSQEDIPSAICVYENAIHFKDHLDPEYKALLYHYVSSLYIEEGRFALAESALRHSLDYFTSVNNPERVAEAQETWLEYYQKLGDKDGEAKSIEALKVCGIPRFQSIAFKASGDDATALEYAKRHYLSEINKAPDRADLALLEYFKLQDEIDRKATNSDLAEGYNFSSGRAMSRKPEELEENKAYISAVAGTTIGDDMQLIVANENLTLLADRKFIQLSEIVAFRTILDEIRKHGPFGLVGISFDANDLDSDDFVKRDLWPVIEYCGWSKPGSTDQTTTRGPSPPASLRLRVSNPRQYDIKVDLVGRIEPDPVFCRFNSEKPLYMEYVRGNTTWREPLPPTRKKEKCP